MARNFSIVTHFRNLAAKHRPQFAFDGKSRQDWQAWREQLLPAVKATMGQTPPKVPLNAQVEVEYEHDGLIKQRVILDVEDGLSLYAYVFRPVGAKGKLPGILACHGHGPYGKDAVMGIRSSPERAAQIDQVKYDYGLQMAKAGFAVIAIDWRGFGERDDHNKPFWNSTRAGDDQCNWHFLRDVILGRTTLGMDVHDGQAALDYFCSLDFVDAGRLGAMGLSFGGTMTTWMTLCDERIQAADIICYSDRFSDFGMRDSNFCGSQITPGIYSLCDLAELQGLIAPRALLVEIGVQDDCFMVDSSTACFKQVEKIYSAAGVREKLELDLFEGGHGWSRRKSVDFFRKYLV